MKTWLLAILILLALTGTAQRRRVPAKTPDERQRREALAYLGSLDTLQQSSHWPHITPGQFLQDIRKNIVEPYAMNTGRSTNFCGYGAVSYTCLKNDPLLYTKCMVDLYRDGAAMFRNIRLEPSPAIKAAAGKMMYQGDLDIHPADQIWFLSLAHRFKGYLNFFNHRYDKGDENTMWAATNLAKFNRMLRKLCKYKVYSRGSDLIRPKPGNIIAYLQEKLAEGEVYLYLNNAVLRKKNHNRIQKRIPTHYVVLLEIKAEEGKETVIKYWDGGYKTLKEMTASSLKQIIYGISWVKYKEKAND